VLVSAVDFTRIPRLQCFSLSLPAAGPCGSAELSPVFWRTAFPPVRFMHFWRTLQRCNGIAQFGQ
jgi:hypothetical protein